MSQFDQAFQEQLAAHYLRDNVFVQSVGGLVLPEYFENESLAAIVAIQKIYLEKYGHCPTLQTYVQVMKRLVAAKKVKIADFDEVKRLLGVLHRDPLADRQFVIDTIADFARHAALENATMGLADALDSQDQTKIFKGLAAIEEAKQVGATDAQVARTFTSGRTHRQQRRAQAAAGGYTNGGITTGFPELDNQLTPHRGWGRKELNILMGPPKSGKTASMITFALKAAEAGFRVFYASCEVSEDIIEDRSDANVSGVAFKELVQRQAEVDAALEAWEKKPGLGVFDVQAFPIRTLKVSELVRILKKKQANRQDYDLIVVDYLGIMRPEQQYQDKRFGLAEVGQDLRAMGTTFNAAVITGYQTNRTGTQKAQRNVSDGTDAADDYEVVRTADVLITINQSVDERANGEVVLYFSEMRNAESGVRMRFKQDLKCMRFLTEFMGFD
jgi:replicative DNA helicase